MSHFNHQNQDWQQIFSNALRQSAQDINLEVPPHAIEQMFEHYCLMVETNRRFNLTRITEPWEAAVKHYTDSLAVLCADFIRREDKLDVLDVGSGAGFPAVPLAVMCPHWSVTAIDGTRKKTNFIQQAAESIGLHNLSIIHARAADLARNEKTFDLITLRAVGKLRPLLREIKTMIRPQGLVVFYKGMNLDPEEQSAGTKTARDLGLSELPQMKLTIPAPDEPIHRCFVAYQRA
jgi:16S rRNA (guanine527-N7)-methyltransferase